MGCCQSQKENDVTSPEEKKVANHPEAAPLRHPQAEANKNKKDEEAGKKSEVVQPAQPAKKPEDAKNPSPSAPAQKDAKPAISPAPVAKADQKAPEVVQPKPAPSPQKADPKAAELQASAQVKAQAPAPANSQSHQAGSVPQKYVESPSQPRKDAPAPVAGPTPNQPAPKPVPKAPEPAVEAPKKPAVEAPKKPGVEKPFNLKTILTVFNDIRANPSKYADQVQILYLDHINDKNINMRTKIMTNEGKTPYIEAKQFLAKQEPVRKCVLDDGLTAASYLHSVYCAELDELTHSGKGGSGPMERIKVFGELSAGMCAENILNRREVTPEEWILDFVIDDGVIGRGHRKNIFNKDITKVGLGVARKTHQSDWFFTMDFASAGYQSDKSKIPADVLEKSGLADYHRETGN